MLSLPQKKRQRLPGMLCPALNGLWAMETLYGQSKPLAIWPLAI